MFFFFFFFFFFFEKKKKIFFFLLGSVHVLKRNLSEHPVYMRALH